MSDNEKINVLVVEPAKKPYAKEISPELSSLQKEVGGYIQAVYPYEEPVAIICDKEAKLKGSELNRALRDEDGKIYDIVAGTFLVVGLGEEDFSSLSPKHMEQFKEKFSTPEMFMRMNGTLPKNDNTKLLITTAAQQLLSGKMTLAALRAEMTRLARQLPEYDTVLAMYGVGEITAAQLMAEIGDVRRFPRRSSIVGFAGIDPGVDESGKHNAKSVPTTKRGSPHLRKTLYQIVCTYLKKSPADEPVYRFLDKKRAEGKPYFVYMTAAQNKFLRIYYARVKECLETFDAQQDTVQN